MIDFKKIKFRNPIKVIHDTLRYDQALSSLVMFVVSMSMIASASIFDIDWLGILSIPFVLIFGIIYCLFTDEQRFKGDTWF